MPTTRAASRLISVATLFLMAGCFSLSREAPAQKHYVLGSEIHAESGVPSDVTGTVVGLRTPRIAEYLATPFLVVRQGSNEIEFSQFDRWGEGLTRGVNRVVARRMIELAPAVRVELAPWSTEVRPDFVIQLHLLRFEGVVPQGAGASRGEAHLLANWEILRRDDGVQVARGTTEVREPGWTVGDFDDLVRLLDAALGSLASDLVTALEAVPTERTRPSGG